MDSLDRMRLLTRVIERGSFTAAAADLALSRSTATEAIKQLEARLGVRLLERTTRHVTPTLDGQAYYQHCLAILAEVEDAEADFQAAQPQGLLRIDVHGFMARHFILPRLAEFLDRYPRIELSIGDGDRLVDLVREGVDCVLRSGEQADSGMITRRITTLREVTCASPAYLEKHGMPASPDDLGGHVMVGFRSSRTGEVMPLEFTGGGELRHVTLPSRVTVNGSDTMAELARLGFGLVQAPHYRFAEDFARGTLVEVLPDYPPAPTPLSALYPQNRQLAPRVRVFVDWVIGIFGEGGTSGRG
ncbi:LysR family transcriptional regulator [Mesorhizobium sp. M00.F.Ca.ET.216.01.1.1]|uniref:LysR family transcriptional regulator n=1 Tax=Mesorhizobium sp. M00.F.Ca.ET.216.01.1.1 TaxID=2500528 RepID=UPI000FD7B87E|nr:LysR family transcriptional regulator [Mesorhizobium sp. M00.F.Ca.ET.216.01.1.1]TGQ28593.1 LysR family transcriptional regulator [Mesorhizobium sp. M00.F.Ca.ET.216.01.1.1]TJW03892.1 MAG: LysR family transcriptional regulator [Mesorhizobium sp.]TJW41344.1 MAG: LysR family transcriptional regulator [Mesorhizobium sp.]